MANEHATTATQSIEAFISLIVKHKNNILPYLITKTWQYMHFAMLQEFVQALSHQLMLNGRVMRMKKVPADTIIHESTSSMK